MFLGEFLLGLLAWLALACGVLFLFRRSVLRALWREPMLAAPVLIVESDDWGVGPDSDAEALCRLAAVLAQVRDETGQPLVMTLGLVLGLPDGPAILAGGMRGYQRRTLAEPCHAGIVAAINEGREAGVFALQRHGLEHCWPSSLLEWARREEAGKSWLACSEARSETLPSPLQSRWVDAAALPSRPLEAAAIRAAVEEEARQCLAIFGECPTVAVPNTFVWNDAVEAAWRDSGVECIVTPGVRHESRDGAGRLDRGGVAIRNGDRATSGALYVVRNDYFEPMRGHRAERVWDAISVKAREGRPVLLETHRENFVVPYPGREGAMAEFKRAVLGVVGRHPHVRFMSTAVLTRHLADTESPILTSDAVRRGTVFLERVLSAREWGRFLRWSGLSLVLRGLADIGRGVTHLRGPKARP